jgi:hypothetical protein
MLKKFSPVIVSHFKFIILETTNSIHVCCTEPLVFGSDGSGFVIFCTDLASGSGSGSFQQQEYLYGSGSGSGSFQQQEKNICTDLGLDPDPSNSNSKKRTSEKHWFSPFCDILISCYLWFKDWIKCTYLHTVSDSKFLFVGILLATEEKSSFRIWKHWFAANLV